MSGPSNGNGTSQYRIEQLEKEMDKLRSVVRDADTLKVRVTALEIAVGKLEEKVDDGFARVNRGLWLAAGTFASLAFGIFALVVQGLGQ